MGSIHICLKLGGKQPVPEWMLHTVHLISILIQLCSPNTKNMLEALVSVADSYGSNTKHNILSFLGGKKRPMRSTTNPTGKESGQEVDKAWDPSQDLESNTSERSQARGPLRRKSH